MLSSFMVVFLYRFQQFDARPLQIVITSPVPWAQPCTPIGPDASAAQQTKSNIESILEYLIEKLQDSYYHVEYIEHIMVTRLGDSHIVGFLRRKNLDGFPLVKESLKRKKVSAVKLLSVNYDQLSRAAVFLEQISQDEHELEMKAELEDLFVAHLSQMCEIQAGFAGLGLSQILPVADRSIMPAESRRPRNRFRRYVRDMIAMLKYRELLNNLIILYNESIFRRLTFKGSKWGKNG